MGSPRAVATCPPLPQLKLVLDLATPEGLSPISDMTGNVMAVSGTYDRES